MDKFTFIALWDIYRGLLTSTQREITDMYFNLDLTVSEIAEQKGISRQAVSECLISCKRQLEEYENKLHFAERLNEVCMEISFMATDAGRWAEKFKAAHPEFTEEFKELEEILVKDYSEEAQKTLSDPEKVELMRSAAAKQGLKVE